MPTQSTDIFGPGIGISFSSQGQTWKILKNVSVGSNNSFAVYSDYENNKLVNKGTAYSNNQYAVYFEEDGAKIHNKKTGTISGDKGGIAISDGLIQDGAIWNWGDIYGTGVGANGVYAANVNNFDLYNYGKIQSPKGVYIYSDTLGLTKAPKIDNHKTIYGEAYGIFNDTVDYQKTKIVNRKEAVIKSDTYAVYSYDGPFHLVNKGKVKGEIDSNSGPVSDKVINNGGKIRGEVYLGLGDDKYKNKDGKAGKVHGEYGNDTLIAGDKKDKFVFGDAPLSSFSNVDMVRKFEPGKDKFYLDKTYMGALTGTGQLDKSEFGKGSSAKDLDDYIVYHRKSGSLYYDGDGSGGLFAMVKFAEVEPKTDLTHKDFIVMV